jgi:hypothetical protein
MGSTWPRGRPGVGALPGRRRGRLTSGAVAPDPDRRLYERAVAPFEFPEVDPGSGLRLVTPEGLWAIGGDGERQVRVTSFDPATMRVMSRSDPLGPSAQGWTVDAATRTAWVTTGDRIVRLDIG